MRGWVAAVSLVLLVFVTADAEGRPVSLSKRYQTDKQLGVGLMVGTPASVSLKYHFTSEVAVNAGIGANFFRKRDGFHLHADLLWHPFVAVEGITFLAPFYVGGGVRFLSHDSISRFGIRVPFGISFDLGDKPIDIFAELAPIADVWVSEEGRGVLDLSATVGARYYF